MDFSRFQALRQRYLPVLRRVAMGVGALVLVGGLAAGVMVAQVDFAAAERAAIARVQKETGLRIAFAGRNESRFPTPHVRYDSVEISGPAGLLLRAREAELRFRLADLTDGQLDDPAVTLREARITLPTAALNAPFASPRELVETLQRLVDGFERQSAIASLSLAVENGAIEITGGAAPMEVGPLNAAVEYSAPKGHLIARLTQAGSGAPGANVPLHQQQLKLSALLPTRKALGKGEAAPARLEAALGDSRFAFSGKARMERGLTLNGEMEASFGEALERLIGWQRGGLRDGRGEPARLTAGMTLDARGLGLEGLKLSIGNRGVNGIASLRDTGARWNLSATLGGDLVDGTAAHRVLQGIRDERGAWSNAPLSLNPLPGIDLDLRLSSKAFRLGRFALTQVALAVLTRPGRTEMAIVDSRFGEGSFKARVNLGDAADGQQVLRLSASAEGVEGGALLEQALGFDRLTGNGSFVIQAQGQGASVAALVGSLNGTAAFELMDGVVNGIDLNRLMTRAGTQRAETALLFSLVGKTAFQQLRADFDLRKGRLETVGSRFLTPTVDALMEGYSDLAGQVHRQAIVLRKRDENSQARDEFFGFRLEGALLSPSIKPETRAPAEPR